MHLNVFFKRLSSRLKIGNMNLLTSGISEITQVDAVIYFILWNHATVDVKSLHTPVKMAGFCDI